MINGIRIKVCGITSLVDAEAADAIGADSLGFIFYAKSPRCVAAQQYQAMKNLLPERRRVAVSVEPTRDELTAQLALGFEHYQIHFNVDTALETIAMWSEVVGKDELWLAPRLPVGVDVAPEWLPFAQTFLLDTFHKDKIGGTGKTGDWGKFKRHRLQHPQHHWILSGGLSPDNVVDAIRATGANRIDVNSGVELSPGIKSPAKLNALAAAMKTL
ncbi:phosphoribosylanthranilate isomerase [Oleiharenicola lentus]|uniref:phosphoribosylanthranilate isomerase n=1 Tax=Oleiharenicola lentus TaxID=2508720 RepID=UPI003F664943